MRKKYKSETEHTAAVQRQARKEVRIHELQNAIIGISPQGITITALGSWDSSSFLPLSLFREGVPRVGVGSVDGTGCTERVNYIRRLFPSPLPALIRHFSRNRINSSIFTDSGVRSMVKKKKKIQDKRSQRLG